MPRWPSCSRPGGGREGGVSKDHPILFSAPMVLALLEGRKRVAYSASCVMMERCLTPNQKIESQGTRPTTNATRMPSRTGSGFDTTLSLKSRSSIAGLSRGSTTPRTPRGSECGMPSFGRRSSRPMGVGALVVGRPRSNSLNSTTRRTMEPHTGKLLAVERGLSTAG